MLYPQNDSISRYVLFGDRVVWARRIYLAPVHIGAIWRIRLNDPRTAAMRTHVNLLLPPVKVC